MSGVGDVEGSLARDRAFLDAPEVNVREREECDAYIGAIESAQGDRTAARSYWLKSINVVSVFIGLPPEYDMQFGAMSAYLRLRTQPVGHAQTRNPAAAGLVVREGGLEPPRDCSR